MDQWVVIISIKSVSRIKLLGTILDGIVLLGEQISKSQLDAAVINLFFRYSQLQRLRSHPLEEFFSFATV